MDRTIRKASRRIAIDLAARRGALGLLIGSGVGLGALLFDRLAGLALPASLFAAIVAAAVAVAIASALLRPLDRMEAAVRLDRGLGLKDRLGTAEALRQGLVSGEFAELVRADAVRTAAGLDVAAATPIRIGGPWPVGLALAALLAAAIAWVPPLRRAPDPEAANEALDERRHEIAGAIDQAVAGANPDLLDETSRDDIEALDALAKQLAGGDAPPKRLSEARDESAATMEAVADRLDESAQRNLEALDELTRRVTSFEPPAGAPPPEELAVLLYKLRRGDLEEAARQAEEASAPNPERSPEENRELAESLDSLARHLRRPGMEEPSQQEQHEQVERVLEALKDLGMDEAAAEQALQSEDRRALEEALAERGADPETAREMSRDIEELNQDRETREASEALREHLAEALQEAARELEGKDAAPQGEDQQDPQRQPGRQEQSQQPEQPGAAESHAHQEQQGRAEERQQPAHDGEAQQRQVQPDSGEAESQQEGQAPPRQDGGEQEQQERQSQPQGTPPEGTQPDRQRREDEQQAGREAERQQQQTAQDQEQLGRGRRGPAGRPSLPQALRDLERVRREAQGQKALSRELQETARRLADNLTEEERQRLAAQWMQSGRAAGSQLEAVSPDRGRPPGDEALFDAREDVDLREEDASRPGRSVARWSDPEGGPPDAGPGQAAPAAGRAAAQRARMEAEQAVERAAVPSRYHRLIRRYFNKLAEPAPADPAPGNGGTP